MGESTDKAAAYTEAVLVRRGTIRWLGPVALVLISQPALSWQGAPAPLPDRFERYLSTVIRPSARDRSRMLEGAPLTKLIDTDDGNEVAVFGAIWIQASPQQYLDAVNDIETFESGAGFQVTKRIEDPPRREDFAALTLPPVDVKGLRSCRVGDCKIKLDEPTIAAIHARVDVAKPDAAETASAIVRARLLEEATVYQAKGNEALLVYQDDAPPRAAASEFEAMVNHMPELAEFLPELKADLLGHHPPSGSGGLNFLYWQIVSFGLKPTLRMSHVVSHQTAVGTVVSSAMIYSSHYFRAALELRVLVADPSRGPGFWFITINRSRVDGLGGLFGFFIRGRVRGDVQKGVLTVLSATKRKVEGAAPAGSGS
jgi:hypothetical protein